MFWKILIAVAGAFLVVVVLFAGVLFWAQRSGAERQAQFFAAVSSGDPESVMAMFHPALREEVDPPVLAAWMEAVQDKLGTYQGLSKADFHTSANATGGNVRIESKGTVNFEKGTAQSELVFVNDQVIQFSIESEALKDWFHGPAGTALYRQRGKEFLTHLLGNEPQAAFAMMHPELQKIVPLAKLEEMTAKNAPPGKLDSVDYQSENQEPGARHDLTVVYQTRTDKAQQVSSVDFRFIGLKGSLIGFNLNDREAEATAATRREAAVR